MSRGNPAGDSLYPRRPPARYGRLRYPTTACSLRYLRSEITSPDSGVGFSSTAGPPAQRKNLTQSHSSRCIVSLSSNRFVVPRRAAVSVLPHLCYPVVNAMTLAAADWPNCPICHHPRYAHLQSVGVSAQRPASGGRQLGLPVRRDPVHLLNGHVRRAALHSWQWLGGWPASSARRRSTVPRVMRSPVLSAWPKMSLAIRWRPARARCSVWRLVATPWTQSGHSYR